jgi:MFS family permease
MTSAVAAPHSLPVRVPFYYGWVNLVVAAVAMTATLPGRTHGLGLLTKPLTEDPALRMSERLFTTLNFWAILIGSALCLPVGRFIDRFGVRAALVGVAVSLGLAVVGMSYAAGIVVLFVALTLVRGLGQGALSLVSMATVGKWFTRRLPVAMGVYSVLLAIGFIAATLGTGAAVAQFGWRPAWAGVGWCLLFGLAPLAWFFVRSTPEEVGLRVEELAEEPPAPLEMPVRAALRLPAFWVFTLSAALFNLMWSAVTLLNEFMLAERRFGKDTFLVVMAVLAFSGLPANLVTGWLARRWPMGRLLAVGMVLLAASLLAFPFLTTQLHVLLYGACLGVSGGIITVIWFAAYGHAFGRAHLGSIQAVAQIATVLASALGPWLAAVCKETTGSYEPLFYAAALPTVALSFASWWTRLPDAYRVPPS